MSDLSDRNKFTSAVSEQRQLEHSSPSHHNEAKFNCRPEIAVGLCALQVGSGCKHGKQKGFSDIAALKYWGASLGCISLGCLRSTMQQKFRKSNMGYKLVNRDENQKHLWIPKPLHICRNRWLECCICHLEVVKCSAELSLE